MKLTEISRGDLHLLGQTFADALKDVGDTFGIKIEPYGGKYGGPSGEVRLKVTIVDPADPEKIDRNMFEAYASWFGLDKTDFNRTFVSGGVQYRIKSLKPGAAKYPVIAERVRDGKRFKFPQSTVKSGLLRSVAA